MRRLLAALILCLGMAAPAAAQTTVPAPDRLAEAERRLTEVGVEAERAAERFNGARVRLDLVRIEEVKVGLAVVRLRAQAGMAEGEVRRLAVAAYKRGPASLLAVLSGDATQFSDRSHYLDAVHQEQRAALDALRAVRSDAEGEVARLASVRDRAQEELASIDAERDRVEALLAEQQRLVEEYREEHEQLQALRAAEEAEARRAAEAAQAARRAEQERQRAQDEAAALADAVAAPPAAPAVDDQPASIDPPDANDQPEAINSPEGASPQDPGDPAAEQASSNEDNLASSPGADTAVEWAKAQLGKPYVYGDAGPDSFDCSGLTWYVWDKAGVSLPRTADMQFYAFPQVSRDGLQPGDLVYFGSPEIHHVGIYVGGGSMIAAPQTGDVVSYRSIDRHDYFGANRPGA